MKLHCTRGPLVLGTLCAQILALSACGDSGTVDPIVESGSIVVTVQTSAATAEAAMDSDGYSVSAGPQNEPVASNGAVTFDDISPGEHVVTLEGLQANCTTPDNPGRAAVVANGTAQVAFQVTCWPPGVGRIAFTSNDEVFSMNPDGRDLVQVTREGKSFWPAWSPDDRMIAFSHSPIGNSDIYLINADGSGLTQLTSHSLPEQTPAWSPDGSRIAFSRSTSSQQGPEDIFVVDADGGGNEVQLTNDQARDFLPAWSPDGSKILFTSDRDGNDEVYVMNADGSNHVNLTNNPAADVVWAGAWSPDGARIVFQTGRDGNGELYVMNADGSNPRNLTNSSWDEKGGSWSPDGTKVVFWQAPWRGIFSVNADGTGMVNIFNSGDLNRYPHWSH